ncbi:hypothetical protein D9542_11530 [Corynebacterium macginleyi]|nr:hypothetical protein D9542_11530 [Corynebacterium macginleyi]
MSGAHHQQALHHTTGRNHNALAESFNATLKREVLRDRKVFDNPISCRQEVFRWCMRYNTRRRHSWCNLVAPDVFETKTSAILTTAA